MTRQDFNENHLVTVFQAGSNHYLTTNLPIFSCHMPSNQMHFARTLAYTIKTEVCAASG